jgi:hypothetical protein
MLSAMVLSIPTLVLPLVIAPPRDCQHERFGDTAQDARALASFEQSVEHYVALHRRLERAWPPGWFFADPEQAEMAAEALRTALRDARPQAAQGSFFTPAVADVFRWRIANALRDDDCDPAVIGWPPADDEDIDQWKPVINQPIPWGVSGVRWPTLAMLPPLPPELAYRFVGRDLVLVDVHANLVLDMLDLALPTVAFTGFAVEPFLPAEGEFEACWPDELPAALDRRDPNERHRLDEEQ